MKKQLIIFAACVTVVLAGGVTIHISLLDGLDGLIWSRLFEEHPTKAFALKNVPYF